MNTDSYKYKYDLHVHTSPVSPCGDFAPEEVVDIYKNLGYAGVVITNHFHKGLVDKKGSVEEFAEYFLNDFRKAKAYGETCGLDVILGMEARFPENANDYLVFGVSEEDVHEAVKYIDTDYKTFYTNFKSDKNLIIQAHPFRDGCVLQDTSLLDGIEVFNLHPGHNSRVAFAAKAAYENPDLLVIGGSDFHHEGHYGMCAMCSEKRITDSYELAETLKNHNYILDIWGNKILPKI